jgi:hypothetical protein
VTCNLYRGLAIGEPCRVGSSTPVSARTATARLAPATSVLALVTALNGWLLAYDDISSISGWLSDGLCLVATGGSYAGRTGYTRPKRTVFQIQRPAVLTGIDEFLRRGDLIDRAVIIHLAPCRRVRAHDGTIVGPSGFKPLWHKALTA